MDHAPVTHRTTDRALGQLPSGSDVTVTVHRYVGGTGPTVYIQAAQHGIELNGPATLRRLHERLVGAEIAGTVVVVPVANPIAFDHRTYLTPAEYDVMNPNLNRVWPGDDTGSLQERLAAQLWELVTGADAAIDLHTGTADMLEHVRFTAGDETARTLASAFGTSFRIADEDETADGDRTTESDQTTDDTETTDVAEFSGKFRTAATRAGIPALTVELSNSRQVTPAAIRTGVEGIQNVLRELDLLPASPDETPAQTELRNDGASIDAAESGLVELESGVAVGDHVSAGEKLGTVYDPSTFEARQTVTATESGIAYSLAREGVVVAGERIAGIATPV